MSKTKLLLDVADGLRGLADSVAAVAEAMIAVEAVESASEAAPSPTPANLTVTLEQVRAALADVSRAGKTEAVRALLGRFGADRLSAIEPAKYPELLHEAESL